MYVGSKSMMRRTKYQRFSLPGPVVVITSVDVNGTTASTDVTEAVTAVELITEGVKDTGGGVYVLI